jgi:hypothetical protein
MSSSATEETNYGGYRVDGVVLRLMIQEVQEDNCVCRVAIDNQVQPVSIGLRKYDGLRSSTLEESECGLAVDITHIPDMSTESVLDPIECIDNVNYRNIQLLPNGTLQSKSRIINGTFTRGYCMRIHRGNVASK